MGNNQKVLVTGGAGFIGSHLVDALINNGHFVIVLDNLIEGHLENIQNHIDSGKCQFKKEDILNLEFLLEKLPKVDVIYHFAADPDVRLSVPNPLNSFKQNVQGTLNVLEYARKYKINKFIFASSGGTVYGDVNSFPMTEKLVLNPISPYGASKVAGEMYLAAYASSYHIKSASVRFANIFGERSLHGVGYDFFNHLNENPTILKILGDGTQKKSYLHVSDAINGVLLVSENLNNQESWYDFFNLGSEDWFTVNEIANIYEKELNLFNVKHSYSGGSKGWVGDVAQMMLSIDKVKKIGFLPKVSFVEGVHRYCEWLKNNA
ncbi:NAD-dependent epimerase/dehydratase family protein [Promethearchaeum syntrophicum]|uniref:NAD-dependent epimerase/dehydratase family protein n=1 Tax=Promethearchaeum syntrophicum TaxID=2594042 RepID=A0A5B9DAP9_9ARCH